FLCTSTAPLEISTLSLHDALPIFALLQGRYAEAEDLTEKAYSLGERSEAENAAQFFGVQTFLRYREQGRLRDLEPSVQAFAARLDRKSTRLNSSHSQISYAVFCLK